VKRLRLKAAIGGKLQQIHCRLSSTIAPSTAWFRHFCSSMALTMRHKLNKSLGALWQIITWDYGN
jgi:hypothetical protein